MTITTIPLPTAAPPDRHGNGDGASDEHLGQDVLAALDQAASAGEQAAAWIRSLAERQNGDGHRGSLVRAADAVKQVTGAETILGGSGGLTEELRYSLDACLLLGSPHFVVPLDLNPLERTSLVAVTALAAAMATFVLCDLARELPTLCEAIENAVAAGRDTAPACQAILPVVGPRTPGATTTSGDGALIPSPRPRRVEGPVLDDAASSLARETLSSGVCE